jgi:hypothetical protein
MLNVVLPTAVAPSEEGAELEYQSSVSFDGKSLKNVENNKNVNSCSSTLSFINLFRHIFFALYACINLLYTYMYISI